MTHELGEGWREVENLIVSIEKAKSNQRALRAEQSPHYTLYAKPNHILGANYNDIGS